MTWRVSQGKHDRNGFYVTVSKYHSNECRRAWRVLKNEIRKWIKYEFREISQLIRWRKHLAPAIRAMQTGYSLSVISDEHSPFKSMADGKFYDSKSAYRRTIKGRFDEVGDMAPLPETKEYQSQSYKDEVGRFLQTSGLNDRFRHG